MATKTGDGPSLLHFKMPAAFLYPKARIVFLTFIPNKRLCAQKS